MKHFSLVFVLLLSISYFTNGQDNPITAAELTLIYDSQKGLPESKSITDRYFEHAHFKNNKAAFKTRVLKQKLDSTYRVQSNPSGTWYKYHLNVFEYTSEGYCSSETKFTKDSTTWDPRDFVGYTYNKSGQVITDSLASWNIDSNKWNSKSYTKYEYTESGDPAKLTYYYKDEDTGLWFPSWKEEFTYDSNGNFIKLESSEFIGYYQKWFPKLLQTNEYNNQQQKITEINSEWKLFDTIWVLNDKRIYSYDVNNNNTLMVHQFYNTADSIFYSGFQEIYSYNQSNQITQMLYQIKSNVGWNNRVKIYYTYDSYGVLADYTWYYWYYVTQDWRKSRNDFYTYDNDYSKSELLLPPQYENVEGYSYMLVNNGVSTWDSVSSSWINVELLTHYYSEQYVNSTIYPTTKDFIVYPNPVTDELYFSFPNYNGPVSIQIYDAAGKLIQVVEIQNNECIDLSKESKGIYLYQAIVNNEYYMGKVVKW